MPDLHYTAPTESYGDVEGFTNAYIANEVQDARNSALDHQIFTTVDTTLTANVGDIYHVNRIILAGVAQDVAEGYGNTSDVSTDTAQVDYEVKTAQARFVYTDERLRRTPNEVAAGLGHLGTTIYNKINTEIVGELAKGSQTLAATALDFDAVVDAQNLLDLDTFSQLGPEGEGENSDASKAPQTMMLVGKALRAAIRKACKDELKYVEAFVRTGYVGTLAGTNIYYSKLMDADDYADMAFLFTNKAVTTFIKENVEIEQSNKGNRSASDANTRTNTAFARQVYVVALTDDTKVAVINVGGGGGESGSGSDSK